MVNIRVYFEQFGCENCLGARKAVMIFNSKVPLNEQIRIETIGGTGYFPLFQGDDRWYPLIENIWKGERKRVPFLIFDGIVVRGLDDFESYLTMLEELNKKEFER